MLETIAPLALIFGMLHYLVDLICSNHGPSVNIGPTVWGSCFNKDFYRKFSRKKRHSSEKLHGLELRYLVCSNVMLNFLI